MNDKITGAFDKILGVNTSAFLALGTLFMSVILGGYYIGQMHSDFTRLKTDSGKLCLRIKDCVPYTEFPPLIDDARHSALDAQHHVESVQQGLREVKDRVAVAEQKIYNLITNPNARPGAFTKTDGDALKAADDVLRARVESLEIRLQNRQIP